MARPSRPLALITGASRGIGLAIAEALAPEHDLLLVARAPDALAAAAGRLEGTTGVETLAVDLADATARAGLLNDLEQRDRSVSVLVNNAGVAPSAPLHRTDAATWARTLTINLTAPFELLRVLSGPMRAQGWGRVVNIASTAALKGYRYTTAYSASKGGLLALTRAASAELAPKGITVNAICPGFTNTDIVADAVEQIQSKTGRSADEARASLERFSPIGRLVEPAEVAALVRYLVGPDAAAMTGGAFPLDGGETA